MVLNEKSPEVTSVIDVDKPFFPVDSVVFDLLIDERGLLFVFVSLIEDWDCCWKEIILTENHIKEIFLTLLLINFRHFEQYHRHRGSLISAVLTGGLWHFWWYFAWHSWHSTKRLSFSSVRTLNKHKIFFLKISDMIELTCIYCKQDLIQ